jgi:hypothetical protein
VAIPGTHPGVSHPPLVVAFAANAPTSPTGALEVTIPTFGSERSTVVGWAPREALPKVGDECLVAYDERGEPWVVAWLPGKVVNTAGRASRIAAQNLPNVTWTRIKIDTLQTTDPTGNFDLVNGRYICPATGYYQASGQVAMGTVGVAVGELLVGIRVNEAEAIRGTRVGVKEGRPEITCSTVSGIVQCNATDTIGLWAFNNSAAERGLEIAGYENFLSVVRVA